jgi:hypothetical protein
MGDLDDPSLILYYVLKGKKIEELTRTCEVYA